MDKIKAFLNYSFSFGADVHISVQTIIVVILALILASYLIAVFNEINHQKIT